MEPFVRFEAPAAPLPLAQCDTDQIITARFLSRKRAEGFGDQLFRDLRFQSNDQEIPDFVLNRPAYRGAGILVADENFGCGSSRESAVWALYDYGFRAVIAPSFGDIFFNNSTKNGLLPIVLPAERVARLRAACSEQPGLCLSIDLAGQVVRMGAREADVHMEGDADADCGVDLDAGVGAHARVRVDANSSDGAHVDRFDIDPLKKRLLMAGMDEITYTLTRRSELDAFEARYVQQHPWLR